MNQITPYMWALWANTERNSGVTKSGFYHIQSFAKEYRTTEIWDEGRTDPPQDKEIMVASEIAKAVTSMRGNYPDRAQAITLYHGAFPDAPLDRKERMKLNDMPKNQFYEAKRKAEIYIQSRVDLMLETAVQTE